MEILERNTNKLVISNPDLTLTFDKIKSQLQLICTAKSANILGNKINKQEQKEYPLKNLIEVIINKSQGEGSSKIYYTLSLMYSDQLDQEQYIPIFSSDYKQKVIYIGNTIHDFLQIPLHNYILKYQSPFNVEILPEKNLKLVILKKRLESIIKVFELIYIVVLVLGFIILFLFAFWGLLTLLVMLVSYFFNILKNFLRVPRVGI